MSAVTRLLIAVVLIACALLVLPITADWILMLPVDRTGSLATVLLFIPPVAFLFAGIAIMFSID